MKSNCSKEPLLCVQTCIFGPNNVLECLFWNWTSTKSLLYVNNCVRQSFPGASGPYSKRAGADSYLTRGCTARNKFCLPIAQCMVGGGVRPRPGSLVYGAGSHSFHKGIFACGMMPNFCCWGGGQKWGMSHATMMLMSLWVQGFHWQLVTWALTSHDFQSSRLPKEKQELTINYIVCANSLSKLIHQGLMSTAHKTTLLLNNIRKIPKSSFHIPTSQASPAKTDIRPAILTFSYTLTLVLLLRPAEAFLSSPTVASCFDFFPKTYRNSLIISSTDNPGTSQPAPSLPVSEFHPHTSFP